MTKGRGRLRSVTLREAQQFAGQAEEYLQTAIDALGDGRLNAATGNAVHAGINAADAILGARTGSRAGGEDHKQAIPLLTSLPLDGRAAANALGRLVPLKSKAEYDPEPISRGTAELALRQATVLVETARSTIASRLTPESTAPDGA
jgi:hypothetical protein